MIKRKKFYNGVIFDYFFNNKKIGTCTLLKYQHQYQIEKLFILKEYRFSDLGSKLLKEVINYLVDIDIDEVQIKAPHELKLFFIKNGFKEVEHETFIAKNLLKDKKRMKEGLFVTFVTLFLNIFLALVKITGGYLGNSKALIADGIHTISDIGTSIIVFFTLKYSSQPHDSEHPFGHGKLEYISSLIVSLVMILSGWEIFYDNFFSLYNKEIFVKPNFLLIYISAFTIIIKFFMYKYKLKEAKRLNSNALLSDAIEHRQDIISSIAVLIGIGSAIYINPLFDPLAGIVVSIYMFKEGWELLKESSHLIMDIQDKKFIEEIEFYLCSLKNIHNVHGILLQPVGNKCNLYFHVRLDENITIKESYSIITDLVIKLKNTFHSLDQVIIQVDPLFNTTNEENSL